MRVLFTDYYENLLDASATGNRTLSLLNGLSQLGVEVVYYDQSDKNNKSSKSKNLLKAFIARITVFLDDVFLRYEDELILKKTIDQKKPDIIWVKNDVRLFHCICFKIKDISVPIYLEQSEFLDIHRVQNTNPIRSYLKDRDQRFIENRFIYRISGLGLMTKELLKHYTENFKLEIPLLHLPMTVDLNRFQHIQEQPNEFEKPYIAFVGVMNNIKDGVDVLIDAFAKIAANYPKHKLYLVGPWQPDSPGQLQQIANYRLKDRIYWMKTYPREEIPSIISNADLLVLPRPDSKQAQGGFPTKLGEYLATGKPVCATTVGEIPNYLVDKESVFFAKPGSFDSFADAMNKALSDPVLAKEIGINGRRVSEKEFNAEIQSQKLKEYLEQLTQAKTNDKG